MMTDLGQSVLSIICASMLAGIVTSMLPDSVGGELIRLLCGLFITVTILTQIRNMDVEVWQEPYWQLAAQAQIQTQEGEMQAEDQLRAVIKESCESYILDKAKDIGICIGVDIGLSEEDIPIPVNVTILGSVTEEAKEILQEILIQEMGIQKEDQLWSGEMQESAEKNS